MTPYTTYAHWRHTAVRLECIYLGALQCAIYDCVYDICALQCIYIICALQHTATHSTTHCNTLHHDISCVHCVLQCVAVYIMCALCVAVYMCHI